MPAPLSASQRAGESGGLIGRLKKKEAEQQKSQLSARDSVEEEDLPLSPRSAAALSSVASPTGGFREFKATGAPQPSDSRATAVAILERLSPPPSKQAFADDDDSDAKKPSKSPASSAASKADAPVGPTITAPPAPQPAPIAPTTPTAPASTSAKLVPPAPVEEKDTRCVDQVSSSLSIVI